MMDTDVILISLEDFKQSMLELSDLKQWRRPSNEAIERIFESFPENAATKKPFIDAVDFYQAIDRLMDESDRTVPSDIKRFYNQVRMERAKAINEAAAKPELPPLLDTRNLRNERGGEEYVRFKRFAFQYRQRRQKGLGGYSPDKYAEHWESPLTDEDWQRASNSSPADAIAEVVWQ